MVELIKKGIGDGGKTLIQMLEESDRLYRETGYCYGLENLELYEKAPLKLELFNSRVLAVMVAARETTRMIAANPFVREVAELVTGLYTPEGSCVGQSTGILIHIPIMGRVIEWMIRQNHEEEVGINDGDTFSSNDMLIAGMHPPDIADIMPIFWDGELVAWTGTTIMEMEMGESGPPLNVLATECFHDGFRVVGEKTGEKDLIRRDWEKGVRRKVRNYEMFMLSRKGALAANIKTREEMKKVIQEFGIDYFKKVLWELIELERRTQLARMRTRTIPGRLRIARVQELAMSSMPVQPRSRKDWYTLVPIEMSVEASGKAIIDFDGVGPWGWHPANVFPSALEGGMSMLLTQTTAYEGTANMGTVLAVELKTPYDSLVWPSSPYVSTEGGFSLPFMAGGAWMDWLSRLYYGRGFKEEILLQGSHAAATAIYGRDHMGREPFGMMIADIGGTTGSGAFAIRDGLENAFSMWHPETDAGNIEVWELVYPLIWLGRRLEACSQGYGKYRSGCAMTTPLMVYKTPYLMIAGIGAAPTSVEKIIPRCGIFGGYPAPSMFTMTVVDSNLKELIEKGEPLFHSLGNPRSPEIKRLKGKHKTHLGGSIFYDDDIFKDGDAFQVVNFGFDGGYGDPIDRGPGLVKKDLDNGLVLPEAVEKIYCVAATYDEKAKEWAIDEGKTKKLREKKRNERLNRAVPVNQWWKGKRKEIMNRGIVPQLQEMYNGSLAKGERWPKEFRAFWGLSEDFTF